MSTSTAPAPTPTSYGWRLPTPSGDAHAVPGVEYGSVTVHLGRNPDPDVPSTGPFAVNGIVLLGAVTFDETGQFVSHSLRRDNDYNSGRAWGDLPYATKEKSVEIARQAAAAAAAAPDYPDRYAARRRELAARRLPYITSQLARAQAALAAAQEQVDLLRADLDAETAIAAGK